LLGQLEAGDRVVVADFEAGLGTLSRMKAGQLDVLLVVTEPTVKALEVARRAVELIRERAVADVIVLANRVSGSEDRTVVEQAFAGGRVVVVPDDPAIRAADARGVAPYDVAPDAPAVRVLRTLSESLVA
jgi:CO dehydrogenase maturation factor